MTFQRLCPRALVLAAASLSVACGESRDEGGLFGDGGNGGADGSGAGGSGDAGGTDGGDGESGGGGGDDGGGVRFDIGDGTGGPGDGDTVGCQKVDFMFVVDNSGSMGDEQQNLANNFPRFMDVIRNTLMAQDYHVMVVDTDATGSSTGSGCTNNNGVTSCECQPGPACCQDLCANGLTSECNGWPCAMIPMDACDGTLGVGKIYDANGGPCGVEGGNRYMMDSQPDPEGTFSCVAKVGTWGDGNEQPMGAMVTAASPALNGAGGCNEGFIRDDAILVVTFITDEEDGLAGKSPGDPASWKQALVDAKHGNEEAIVVLGLIGDSHVAGGLPGGPCPNADAAEPSPVLQSFVEQFTYGHLGSICAPDYSGFFTDAVDFIDTACEDFVPPG